jgi:hypothetical protein
MVRLGLELRLGSELGLERESTLSLILNLILTYSHVFFSI